MKERKPEYVEAPFGRRRKFQDMSELETRVAAQAFRQTYNKPPIQGLSPTGRRPSEPNWQDLPNPLLAVFARIADIQRREKIIRALMDAGMQALHSEEVEARVWLDHEEDLEVARKGLHILGRTLLSLVLAEEKSTPDCLELTNGSAILLKLKDS